MTLDRLASGYVWDEVRPLVRELALSLTRHVHDAPST
jgi:hypothetical protein